MKPVAGRTFVRLLEQRGWRLLRINGSHHIMGKNGERARISVPVHGSTPLKQGLLRNLMKLAGMSEADL